MPVLYRKYRPQVFDDVVGQAHVTKTLAAAIAAGRLAHAYLFSGPRGVGKTTTARLLAKAVNCEHRASNTAKGKRGLVPCNACARCEEITAGRCMDVLEIDAASHTGVDHVREYIIETARIAPAVAAERVFIIDEVHMLSTSAFNALLKTLEEPPEHVSFILATTELQRVPETVRSRCQHFAFRRVTETTLVSRLSALAASEGVTLADDVAAAIARTADGSVRDAESMLGQLIALGGTAITMDDAAFVLPRSSMARVAALLHAMGENDVAQTLDVLATAAEEGLDAEAFVRDVITTLRTAVHDGAKRGNISGTHVVALRTFAELMDRVGRSDRPFFLIEVAVLTFLVRQGVGERASAPAPPVKQSKDHDGDPPTPTATSGKAQPPVRARAARTTPSTSATAALATVQQAWQRIIRELAEVNRAIPYVLEGGRPQAFDGGTLTIGFRYKLHAEKVRQPGIAEALEGAIAKLLGTSVRLAPAVVPLDEFQVLDRACRPETDDATANAALDVFGGRVLD